MDYFERAKRLVELQVLEQQYEEQRKADREFHMEQENQQVSVIEITEKSQRAPSFSSSER